MKKNINEILNEELEKNETIEYQCGVKEISFNDNGLVVDFLFIVNEDSTSKFARAHVLSVTRTFTGGWLFSFHHGFHKELEKMIKFDPSVWADHVIHAVSSNPSVRVRAAVLGLLKK